MRKLIYSFMLAVAACMMFTSCGDKTFSGTYTFVNVEADIQATAVSVDQSMVDTYINMAKGEYLAEYKEMFKGATITVDDVNEKAKLTFDGETEEYDFVQDNGKFTMYDPKEPDYVMTGTISNSEIILTEDLTEEMEDMFDGMATVDKFAFTVSFVK